MAGKIKSVDLLCSDFTLLISLHSPRSQLPMLLSVHMKCLLTLCPLIARDEAANARSTAF